MAQNSVQNSSQLYPEDIILYVSSYSTAYTSLADLSSASWLNCGALSEYSRESGNESVQPGAFNAEHEQQITKESETINVTLQEFNSSIVNLLRGSVSQQVSTTLDLMGGTSAASLDVLYSGDADVITPCMLWEIATYSDNRTRQTYFPRVFYVSGGSFNPKNQGSGEYGDMGFVLEARESTALTYNSRKQYRIELQSTAST